MSGRRLTIGFLVFLALFAAALVWFQVFAYYQRTSAIEAISVAGVAVPVAGYEGIDSRSSPLKLRGCFRTDPSVFAAATPASGAVPLVAPFWFRCFDAGQLTRDLDTGAASAYALAVDRPAGFDLMVAVYPDGRGYVWRQLNDRYRS